MRRSFLDSVLKGAEVGLDIADGAIVGTYFKEGGVFENRATRSRVEELMGQAKKFREQLT